MERSWRPQYKREEQILSLKSVSKWCSVCARAVAVSVLPPDLEIFRIFVQLEHIDTHSVYFSCQVHRISPHNTIYSKGPLTPHPNVGDDDLQKHIFLSFSKNLPILVTLYADTIFP